MKDTIRYITKDELNALERILAPADRWVVEGLTEQGVLHIKVHPNSIIRYVVKEK